MKITLDISSIIISGDKSVARRRYNFTSEGDAYEAYNMLNGCISHYEKPVTVSSEELPTAGSILAKAKDIVEGSRQQTHGDKERSFSAIADMWNTYLESKLLLSGHLRPHDVASMMVLLKVVRSAAGQADTDHFLDMAGYAALAGELAAVASDYDEGAHGTT